MPLLMLFRCVVWNRTSPVGYEPTVQPLHLPALNVRYKQKSDKRDGFTKKEDNAYHGGL